MQQLFPVAILLFNLVPLYGVLAWDWHVFDLIFLYWFENVIIGVFMITRILIRPYPHLITLIPMLFFAAFFSAHYGMFTYVHGTFVLSLFGKEYLSNTSDVVAAVHEVFGQPQLFMAAWSLFLLQAFDWFRDIKEKGLGADGVKQLTIAPYRRIIVLHLTIIFGGFALQAMNEPLAGLVIFVIIKIVFDFYHWRRDERGAGKQQAPLELTEEKIRELEEQYPEPYVEVNGKRHVFNSFAELKASKYFRIMEMITGLAGLNSELKLFRQYVDLRIAREQQENRQE